MKTYNYATIRELINAAFDDDELQIFCHDHFQEVKNQFTTGQNKGHRVLLLSEYSKRYGQIEKLLDEIKKKNPYQYERYESNILMKATEAASSDTDNTQPSTAVNVVKGKILQGQIFAGKTGPITQVYHTGSSPEPDQPPQEKQKSQEPSPAIGIITALSKEFTAVKVLLENQRNYSSPGQGAGRRYVLGDFPSSNGSRHHCVLTMASMGNNMAATRAALMLEHFPSVASIIMVGIAGAVPNPAKPDEHVRLGDIVISDQGGVIQYDFDKETAENVKYRNPPRPPSAELLEAVQYLESDRIMGQRPWEPFIDLALQKMNKARPGENADELADTNEPHKLVPHPSDPDRIQGRPRIFCGPIASANKLLKNPIKRDALRDKFGVKAVEMEGSGIADATWYHNTGYLVVRGTCDYCDDNKKDVWQEYAAVIAAAYTRALIESMGV